jgi:phage terminase large subunit-like protein
MERPARLVTVFDWVVRILPLQGTEVMFDRVRDVMDTLRKNMHIGRCEFDRWQSVQLIQQIREMGIFAEQKSTTDADYVQWRADCFTGKVRMLPPLQGEFEESSSTFVWMLEPPQLSAAACSIYELLGAQCDPDSHKVTFPEKGDRRGYGSNDTAQVIVHAHALVQRQGYSEKHDDRSRRTARLRAEVAGQGWESRGFMAKTPANVGGVRNWGSNRRGW